MKVVDTTQIYSFAPIATQNDFAVSPSEQLITLTYDQLQELITQAIEKAVQPLVDRISSMETTEEQDVSRLALDIAYDRQRLAKLEKIEPQPLQRDRGEILRALIVANDGKMLAKDARQKLRMDKGNFSRLLDTMKDYIDTKPLHHDKRKLLLIIKNH